VDARDKRGMTIRVPVSIVRIAVGLAALAELAPARAAVAWQAASARSRGGLSGRWPQPTPGAGLGSKRSRKHIAREVATIRHSAAILGRVVFAAGREALVDRFLLGRFVDGAAERDAVLGDVADAPTAAPPSAAAGPVSN